MITKALIIDEPWVSKILNGEKVWERTVLGGFMPLIKSRHNHQQNRKVSDPEYKVCEYFIYHSGMLANQICIRVNTSDWPISNKPQKPDRQHQGVDDIEVVPNTNEIGT